VSEALRVTSYHLVITPLFLDTPKIDPIRHIISNRMADGLVFTRTEPSDDRVKLLLENDFPFICHGRTELATPHPYVDFDNYAFAYQAARKLIAVGAKKLCIILPPEKFTFSHHMRHGFMTAIREEGIAFDIPGEVTLDSKSDDIRRVIHARLMQGDPPDGFICGGEVSALAVMAACHDRGLEIGRDVHLVAKQTSGLFDQVRPRVETIYEDLTEAGATMGRFLLRRIAERPTVAELQALQSF